MKSLKPFGLFREMVNAKGIKGGRLLGLDVGDKYVGLAVSDPLTKIGSPLSVLVRKKSNIDLMATDFQILAVQTKRFINELHKTRKLEGVKYTYWDECFTTKNVDLLLGPLDLHPVHAKSIMDKFAAVGILQGYLDYVNGKLTL